MKDRRYKIQRAYRLWSSDIIYYLGMLFFGAEHARRESFKIVGNKNVKRILDVGCGHGHSFRLFRETFPDADIFAFDSCAFHVRKAEKRAEMVMEKYPDRGHRIIISQGDALDLHYPDDSFDFAYLGFMLSSFDKPEDAQRVIRGVQRVTRRGAQIVIVGTFDPPGKWARLFNGKVMRKFEWAGWLTTLPVEIILCGSDIKVLEERSSSENPVLNPLRMLRIYTCINTKPA